ncbi:hemerythrin domain-containing protein [Cryptosporangium japonicum]|uniref:Hemerythrin domain-containing protein n=1 Tax=Cryptosporangium japonicum TaxID=80872 RepID=A0ABN0UV37_9ACTN
MTAHDLDLEAVDFLLNQHAQIRAGLREVAGAHGPAKAAAFADLRRLITVHETAEQEVLHPRMRELVPDPSDDGPAATSAEARLDVTALLGQERHGTELLAELDRLDPASPEFDRRFTRLAVEIIAHADHEELEEFPVVRERLDLDERRRMGHALRVAEAAAPRHPQPAAAPGAVAAIVERVRDAVRGAFSSH